MTINLESPLRQRFLYALKVKGWDSLETISKDQVETIMGEFNLKRPYWFVDNYAKERGVYLNPLKHEPVKSPGAPKTPRVAGKKKPAAAKRNRKFAVPFQPVPAAAPPAAVPVEGAAAEPESLVELAPVAAEPVRNLVPTVDPLYVPWGNYDDIRDIIASGMFYPVFVTGLSGNGKTFMIEQACANTNREMIRVNITIETDEDDLIGGFRLENGRTVWHNGPVVEAMERGAILLLDECLEENETVRVGTVDDWLPIALKDLPRNSKIPVVSFNMETSEFENDSACVISDKEDEIFELELEDGRTLKMNANHPVIVNRDGQNVSVLLKDLQPGDAVCTD